MCGCRDTHYFGFSQTSAIVSGALKAVLGKVGDGNF